MGKSSEPKRPIDVVAMLKVMSPLQVRSTDPVAGRRRLFADLCRFIGVQVGALPPEAIGQTPARPKVDASDLPPRLAQTLDLLLNGDSEKQVAVKLKLSRNTVHTYVKMLYRKYDVASRGELLALHLNR